MQKIFHTIVELVYWLAIFLSPFLFGVVAALIIYIENTSLLWLSIVIGAVGTLVGIIFAERTRRKYGCASYMARILGSGNETKES